MALSSWLCTNNTKNMLVKIVHPGGHVELHDRPVLAADVMLRNPRCCVAHPNVFQKPWAIVAPETMLMLGQKFYVVPMNTIRKLQRLSPMNSPHVTDIKSIHNGSDEKNDGMINSCCWLFVNKNTPKPLDACPKPSDNEGEKHNTGPNARRSQKEKEYGCLGEDNCFACLLTRIKINDAGDDTRPETRPSNMGSSESTKDEHTRKRTMEFTSKGTRVSPKRRLSFDHWQPSLQSIEEE
ncbi:hypothetical protein VitviT2T_013842 [Vitis vinifera]|uniref:Uncharacterized protein n=1 Tax=Vitis vinifera TaxID=29760 RepID=A0ABY9CIX0_VITVI|nr:hypothetical protein VitviT2T_013842 [Vitis vinifera]